MRPFALIAILTLLFVGKANSQFLDIGNKWIFDTRDYSLGDGSYTEKFDSIEIVSDTLINGFQYFKLLASEDSPCGTFTNIEYLRESNDKIYRLSRNLSDENLMLDFDSQPSYDMNYEAVWFNTEVETSVINDSTRTETLQSGDQLEVTYQRIINNSSFQDGAIYKLSRRVGYVGLGLLFPNIGTGLCDGSTFLNLRCHISEKDTLRFKNYDCYESSIIVSTNNTLVEQLSLSPNPTSGLLYLSEKYTSVVITDNLGRAYQYKIDGNVIDLSSFSNGLYYLTLRTGDKIYSSKVIKI